MRSAVSSGHGAWGRNPEQGRRRITEEFAAALRRNCNFRFVSGVSLWPGAVAGFVARRALYADPMGLALVAHYFERSEALVVWSVLDAAGVPAFVHDLDILTMRPWDEVAFGGYRIVVSEDDLVVAVEILREARRKPIFEGERLVVRHYIAVSVLPILAFILWGWIPFLPFGSYAWRSLEKQGSRGA